MLLHVPNHEGRISTRVCVTIAQLGHECLFSGDPGKGPDFARGKNVCDPRPFVCMERESAGKEGEKKKLFNRGTPNRERNKRSLYLISERRRVPVGRTGLVEARRKLSYAGD